MESETFGIGEAARSSGLTVSALRFYDDAGVLTPAVTDPRTGYRRYGPDQVRAARLIAALRRVGMPLAEITLVLARRSDPPAARRLVDAHLLRLEDGLAAARRELRRVHTLLDPTTDQKEYAMSATPTRVGLTGQDLARAIDTVRHAVSRDPALPALGGVYVEIEPDVLRLVATDRYRLAVATVPVADVAGPPAGALVPLSFADDARALRDEPELVLTVDDALVSAAAGDRAVSAPRLDLDFPDYRRLPAVEGVHRVTVDVAALRRELAAAPVTTSTRARDGVAQHVCVLTLTPRGGVTAAPHDGDGPRVSEPASERGVRVSVNREFLLQALTAPGRRQLTLELDGPIRPLAFRVPDDEGVFSLLMPVRPEE